MKKWNSQILGIPLALLVLGFLTPNAMAQDSRADATNQDPRSGPSRAIPPSGPPRFQERVPPSQSNPHRSDRADGSETSPSAPPPVLAILAHPDDEILIAPILARMAREGGEVTVVFATSGEAGPGVSDMEPGEALAAVREDEARCAAFALGLPEPIFWQLGDGRLAIQAHSPGEPSRRVYRAPYCTASASAPARDHHLGSRRWLRPCRSQNGERRGHAAGPEHG